MNAGRTRFPARAPHEAAMDCEVSSAHTLTCAPVLVWARKELGPIAAEIDRTDRFSAGSLSVARRSGYPCRNRFYLCQPGGSALAVYHTAVLAETGRRVHKETAAALLFAAEIATRVCRDAVQIHGGYGYMLDAPVQCLLRDAKLLEIGAGTSEICRLIIARVTATRDVRSRGHDHRRSCL